MSTRMIPIDAALCDKALLGGALGDHKTWAAWLVVLKAAFGITLTEDERQAFAAIALSLIHI